MNHQFPTTATATQNSTNSCSNCYIDDRFLLHNVRLRGTHRRLCTSCVLKLHPCSFCPHCFHIFDSNPQITQPNIANRGILRCLKCPSESHSNCVPAHVPKSPFLCPPCSNPTFKFFDLRGGKGGLGGGEGVGIDERAAKVLVAAARIAAESMRKAAGLARVEAERRVKEAAVARKRAREALERVALLSASEGKGRDGIENGAVVRAADGNGVRNGAISRETNPVAAAPMDVKGLDSSALEVIGKIEVGFEVEIVKVHMDVDAAVSCSKGDILGGSGVSPVGKVDDNINGRLGRDKDKIVAVHMEVDAVNLLTKNVDFSGGEVPGLETVDEEIDMATEVENALAQEVKNEGVQMDTEAPVAMQNKAQIVGSEVSVAVAVDEDAGTRELSVDVQTLVVKMEQNGAMIANGITEVVVSPPKVTESAVNEKDGAQLEEKQVSVEKAGNSLPPSSKHDEKDAGPSSQ